MKKVSMKERVELYEKYLRRLHFERHVTGSERRVLEMLSLGDELVMSQMSHDRLGKPLTEEQINENINAAFEKVRQLP